MGLGSLNKIPVPPHTHSLSLPLLGLLLSLGCWVRARQKPSKDPAKTQHLGKWQGGLARRAHSRLGGLGARRFSRHTPGNRPAGAACSFSRLAHKPPTPHRPFAAILRCHLPTAGFLPGSNPATQTRQEIQQREGSCEKTRTESLREGVS